MPIDTPDWVRDAVFYQIFPDRFARSARIEPAGPYEAWDAPPTIDGIKGGDLYGVAERLGELADLGVNAVYLTPVFSSASNHRYHAYDYLAVDPILGGDAALRELLDRPTSAASGSSSTVCSTTAGRGFWPFHHVLETGGESPYRDWFYLDQPISRRHRREHQRLPATGVGARAAPRSATGPGGACPRCPSSTPTTPPTREYLLGVAEHWLRFGIDGWRLDVPAEIEDPTFWRRVPPAVSGRSTRRHTSSARSGTRHPSGSRAIASTR